MTEPEKILAAKNLAGGEWEDTLVSSYLAVAANEILNVLYPYGENGKEVPEKHHWKQCKIAAYLMNKRGAEGELSHSENGVSRSYESADIPESMLRGIVPFVKVL